MILIIGAGLAGLICAKELHRRGCDDFALLEASDAPGGRVRSRVTPDGFVLDQGFQVLLDSYPAVRRHLDIPALEPRYFDSGAILRDGERSWTVANPLRHPRDLPQSAFGNVFPMADRVRLAALVAELLIMPDDALLAESRSERDVSTAHYLLRRGFTSAIVERFFRPFFGGILLEDRLATSAGLFRYYLKKFAVGRALLPARGMGEIPRQLAAGLPAGSLRLNCRVEQIEIDETNRRARAVVTEAGERIPCERLLLATQEPASARLLGDPAAADKAYETALGCTTLYFQTSVSLYARPLLALPAGRKGIVRDFAQISNVAPEYAPAGRHLVSASILDRSRLLFTSKKDPADPKQLARFEHQPLGAQRLIEKAQTEIAALFPQAEGSLTHLATVQVPYAQHPHPAGYARHLPHTPAPTRLENVWLAGDQTTACSIQTAMESGERAAEFLARTVDR